MTIYNALYFYIYGPEIDPINEKRGNALKFRLLCAACALAIQPWAALAQSAGADTKDEADGSFRLGEIIVTGTRPDGIAIGNSTLSQAAIETFSRNTLDDAVNLIPGVNGGNSGGSRNERLLFVRGFDRFQVPLSIDGIRVYLPADNRLDFGRFLTPDIAQIQVAKGYASVLDGPGAMGGSVNLVTRKPTKALDIEVRGQLDLGRDVDYAGYTAFGLIGTRHDQWYAQASFARSFRDHWDLSGKFTPTVNENGGARDFSRTEDWRLNAKIGFTPNATDEYAISYTRQEGSKNAPLSTTDDITPPIAVGYPTPRYWAWPYWNIENIYFLSTTMLGDKATLKTRVYRNTLDNLLRSFDDRTQTTQNAPQPRVFNSPYADEAWGGSAELAFDFTTAEHLAIAFHYRSDKHVEAQQTFPNVAIQPQGFTEPAQEDLEDTFSIAAENRFAISPELSLTLGASYDWRDLKKAEEYGIPPGGTTNQIFSYPLVNAHAFNWQGRLDWALDTDTAAHISISSRARFPTIFERFSTQFGTAASNPGLKPERATNVEIGGRKAFGNVRLEGAIFYSKVDDAVVSVRPQGSTATTTRRENLGDGNYYGAEVSLDANLMPSLAVGANYSYIRRSFDIRALAGSILPAAFDLTDVPTHKAFAYADWEPVKGLHVVPNVEIASDRSLLATYAPPLAGTPTVAGPPVYYRGGAYTNVGLRIDYAINDAVEIGIGARNLFDENYALADGFPEPGRNIFLTLRARY